VPYTGGEPNLVFSGSNAIPYQNWTSDGEKLIFWNRTQGDIFIMTINDRKLWPLKLVPAGKEVSGITLSKDNSELVVSLGPYGGDKNLLKVNIDNETLMPTGKPSFISVTPTEDIQCMFSPDGSKLAFSVCQLARHLWAFPLDTATGLTSGEPERITFRSQQNYYPAFSHNGRMLVWTSHVANQGTLFTLDIKEQIEKKATREWGPNAREIGGSFSPDGKQICYSSTIGESYEIWRLPSLGSIALKLTKTQHPDSDAMTAWSPDGETVAFYSNRSGSWDIWSIQADGSGQPKQLTDRESNENYPSWSPDGQNITFKTDKEGNGDIWIMEADGGNQKPFVVHPDDDGWSAWSPNGRWFYFISNRSGAYNVWIKPANGSEARQVTTYKGLPSGLPNNDLYTKFAVSSSFLIVPVETRKGNIYILKNMKE
jgi:Tol biopolymer transport system component